MEKLARIDLEDFQRMQRGERMPKLQKPFMQLLVEAIRSRLNDIRYPYFDDYTTRWELWFDHETRRAFIKVFRPTPDAWADLTTRKQIDFMYPLQARR